MLLPLFFTATGLILLLAGMVFLREGLRRYAGSQLEDALHRFTVTPAKGFFSGLIVTVFLQSSTALTVMAVSFVDAGLIRFENALAVILGSNIGTTLTPQLLAFPLGKISRWLIGFGLAGFLILKIKKNRARFLLLALTGLGLMFFSLSLLEQTMTPLAKTPWVGDLLHKLHNNYFYCITAGVFLAALFHSSTAAASIAMLLTEEGWLTLPASLAFIFGANIGTCFTAWIVSLFASKAAQKVAIFHILVNVVGVILFYPFLLPLADVMRLLGGDLSRQVANAHTIFNLVSSVLLLPFLPSITILLNKLRK